MPRSATDLFVSFRLAVRRLTARPGASLLAVAMLGLGIGVATAIFSIVNGALLTPLPFPDSDRLVQVWESNPERGWEFFSVADANFLDWQASAESFEVMGALAGRGVNLTGPDAEPERLDASLVTAGFLEALALKPLHGRLFRSDEERPDLAGEVVILTEELWRRRFAGDPEILGTTITLDGSPRQVVGVLPALPDFVQLDVLLPFAADPGGDRGSHELTVFARLAAGVSPEEAEAEMVTLARGLAAEHPETNEGWSVRVTPLIDVVVDEDFRRALMVLSGAVAFLLIIACSNLANLLLSRAVSRRRELAVRQALGAGRGRLLGAWMAESLVLSLAGGALGAILALWGVDLLKAVAPGNVPRLDEVGVDLRVLAFAFALAVVAGLLSAFVPGLIASAQEPQTVLKEGGRGSGGGRGRGLIQGGLVAVEVALALVLLAGAGLLLRSFWNLHQVELGLEADSRTVFGLNLSTADYPEGEDVAAFYRELIERVEALPGVHAAATASALPFGTFNTVMEVDTPERPASPGSPGVSTYWRIVTPGYFRTLGIDLRAGRTFDRAADGDSQPVVVSESLARRLWGEEDPIGRRINSRGVVIGVVEDLRERTLDADPHPMLYLSLYDARWSNLPLIVHASTPRAALTPEIRAILNDLDADLPLARVTSLDELIAESVAPRRFHVMLTAVFGVVSLLLALGGIYGVVAYQVRSRLPEIGIRMALGARPDEVLRLVLGWGGRPLVVGVLLGLGLAVVCGRFLASLLFGIDPLDLPTLAAVAALLLGVGLAGSLLPARRAVALSLPDVLSDE